MNALAIITLVGLCFTIVSSFIGCTWYLGTKVGGIDTKVDVIMTNHLPHIYEMLLHIKGEHVTKVSSSNTERD